MAILPRLRRAAPALGAAVLASALQAQRELVLQNLAPYPRTEVAAVVVPFAAGACRDRPDLHVDGAATEWQPFGARWPDGSVRHALCLFRTTLGALQQLRVPLAAGPGERPPAEPPPPCDATIEIVATSGGATARGSPRRVEDLEANGLRRVERRAARIGDSGLVAELLLTTCRDQGHVYADVAVFWSDPRTAAMERHFETIAVEVRGKRLRFRHAGRLAVQHLDDAQGSRAVLLRDAALGDGQGLRRAGALLPLQPADRSADAAALVPVLGATTWRDSGAFGAYGVVPELPPWLAGGALREHLAARHRRFVQGDRGPGDPFASSPLGLARYAGQTGDQADFGVVKLSLVPATGLPSMLYEAEASVLQEACRPVHFFEADGSPVAPEAHPGWIVWAGRTHWHPEVSPDRLGKPVPEPKFTSHGWTGKDREHWSSNCLGAFALLTGAHWARLELQNEARLYLAGQTVDPRLSTSGAGAPRGAGRTALAATWIYLATGDERLRARIDERVDRVEYPQWDGRGSGPDRVRAFTSAGPDPRQLQGRSVYWNPWQEAIAAVGFGAVHRVTGNPRARELAEGLAANTVRHGWRLDARTAMVALALRWQDGRPLTAADHGDPAAAQWPTSSGFAEWALGACEIARVAAVRDADDGLAARAAAIQQRVRAGRSRPGPDLPERGGLDRLAEWDAVRWQ